MAFMFNPLQACSFLIKIECIYMHVNEAQAYECTTPILQ